MECSRAKGFPFERSRTARPAKFLPAKLLNRFSVFQAIMVRAIIIYGIRSKRTRFVRLIHFGIIGLMLTDCASQPTTCTVGPSGLDVPHVVGAAPSNWPVQSK